MRGAAPGLALALIAALLPAWLSPAAAAVERFEIVAEQEGNRVQFESRAPLERIVGATRAIRGWIEVDPEALGDSARVRVEVELATLDTGIALRDQHMRENHLETDRFPLAIFRGARILPDAPSGERRLTAAPQSVEIAGEFELHGVRRPLQLPVQISLRSDGEPTRLAIECRFRVRLSDFGIARPQFLVMKLSDDQEIVLTANAVRRAP